MDLQNSIGDAVKGSVAATVGRIVGTDQAVVEQILKASLPIMLGQMCTNCSVPDGAHALYALLANNHLGGKLLDDAGAKLKDGDTNKDGAEILDFVFGAKLNAAVGAVAAQTDSDPVVVERSLTFLAPLTMAYLGKQMKAHDLDAVDIVCLLKSQTHNGTPLTELASSILNDTAQAK